MITPTPLVATRSALAVVLAAGALVAALAPVAVVPVAVARAASARGVSSARTSAPACRSTYRPPDPRRPRMTLDMTVSNDHRLVTGTERVVFRPDLPISELVFRLIANSPGTVQGGTHETVTAARADHGGSRHTFSRAGAAASTQGGLLHIPLGPGVGPGSVVHAVVRFRLVLGPGSGFDRFGRTGGYAYLGSGEPLLAWQDGVGWHTEPMSALDAETTTSEAMDVHLTVHAPSRDTVVMTGDPAVPPVTAAPTRTWHADSPTARDVSVSVGPFHLEHRRVMGARLLVGADDDAVARVVISRYRLAMLRLARKFGPYPYASLDIARIGNAGGGIEYPGSILAFNSAYSLAVHETAHQWFYGMVGDSQAEHPWLDEAFAVYSQTVVGRQQPPGRSWLRDADVDQPVSAFPDDGAYVTQVYLAGGEALIVAREVAGGRRWDAAMRCYVARNAWRIARPRDVERAFAAFPRAEGVLRRAGAIP